MIRKQNLLPPYEYLMQVLLNCPEVGFTYVQIWNEKEENNTLHICKDEIENRFLMTKDEFLNHLRKLARQALVNIDEGSKSYSVELLDWDEEIYEMAS